MKSLEGTLTQQAKQNFHLEAKLEETNKRLTEANQRVSELRQPPSTRNSQLVSRAPSKREEQPKEPVRQREKYERPPEQVCNIKPSPEKKVERVDISPRKQQQSEYGTGPSYKERRVA